MFLSVVDYGVGNLRSIAKSIEKANSDNNLNYSIKIFTHFPIRDEFVPIRNPNLKSKSQSQIQNPNPKSEKQKLLL